MTSAVRNRQVEPGRCGRPGQRGAVLVVGLIFLALLTLIGVTAFSVATQEERMAGNARDRLRAFEAAEAALRHCESLLTDPIPPALAAPDTNSSTGMYGQPPTGGQEKWETVTWTAADSLEVPGGRTVWDEVAAPPRCIVQRLAQTRTPTASQRAELAQGVAVAYQVTGRGVGANRNTAVVLQTSFIRD